MIQSLQLVLPKIRSVASPKLLLKVKYHFYRVLSLSIFKSLFQRTKGTKVIKQVAPKIESKYSNTSQTRGSKLAKFSNSRFLSLFFTSKLAVPLLSTQIRDFCYFLSPKIREFGGITVSAYLEQNCGFFTMNMFLDLCQISCGNCHDMKCF